MLVTTCVCVALYAEAPNHTFGAKDHCSHTSIPSGCGRHAAYENDEVYRRKNADTCRWHGSCRTYPKNANSHVICKVKKTEKCISPVSSVKCLGKKNHMTWDLCIQKDAKHVMSTNSHTVHFTSHMNKDSILVYDYLLAVGIIQNYTSAVRIFQSHMNPFTSLFYLATI